jgi:hypothetical protein
MSDFSCRSSDGSVIEQPSQKQKFTDFLLRLKWKVNQVFARSCTCDSVTAWSKRTDVSRPSMGGSNAVCGPHHSLAVPSSVMNVSTNIIQLQGLQRSIFSTENAHMRVSILQAFELCLDGCHKLNVEMRACLRESASAANGS